LASGSTLVVTNKMPTFRVTVTASLRPVEQRESPRVPFSIPITAGPSRKAMAALDRWASNDPGRSFESDASILPPRATITVDYGDVAANDEDEAEAAAKARFLHECDVVESSEWESVVAIASE
jgi:hypothetical protein